MPTDDWQTPRQEILSRQSKKVINVVTVGCGPNVDVHNLKEIGMGEMFIMGNDDASFTKFFEWVSQSVTGIAKEVSKPSGGEKPVSIAPPPSQMQYIP